MLRIGDFSKLGLVSIKTLRYYDELGLLKPVHVDEFTGYRYYSTSQLARLHRIMALKDMGLALDQIARLLDQDLTPEQIRGMLRLKQVELEEELIEGERRLVRVKSWLCAFEEEALMPAYEVVLKRVDSLRVARVHVFVPRLDQIGPLLGRAFEQVATYIQAHNATPRVPGITIYEEDGYCEKDFTVSACLPFEGELQGNGEIEVCDLSAIETAASVIHHGPFSTLGRAYEAGFRWIEANSYRVNFHVRELNLEYEPGGDPNQYVTEIQFPIEKPATV